MTGRPALVPLARLRLARQQRAAAAYAAAGWPVVAGSWWVGDRYRCGVARCTVAGLHVVCGGPATSVDRFPHSLLLVTGSAVDVVELPATALGAVAAAAERGVAVARMPEGRYLLFTGSGRLDPGVWPPEDLRRAGVLVHGEGSLVPLPPSQLRGGPVRWRRARPRLAVNELLPVAEVLARVLLLLPAALPAPEPVPQPERVPVRRVGLGGVR